MYSQYVIDNSIENMDLEAILDILLSLRPKSNLTDIYLYYEDVIYASPTNETECADGQCLGEFIGRAYNGPLGESDMLGAASSGYGHCPEGIPVEFALLSILAAFGVAFGILYRTLTLTTAGRKKREFGSFVFSSILGDIAWAGTQIII